MSDKESKDRTIQDKAIKLTIRGAIIAGSIGGLLFGLNFGLQAFVAVFQITGVTGLVTGFTVPFFLALASQHNREWGTATLAWTLYSILAIPTLLMGVPGPIKVPVGFIGGLAYDLGYCGLKCRKGGLYLALLLYVTTMGIAFYVFFRLGLIPEVTGGSVIKILAVVTSVFTLEGLFSTWLAIKLYEKRLKIFLR